MMTRVLLTFLVGLVVSLGALVFGGSGVASAGVLPNGSPEEQYRFALGRALQNDLETAEAAFDEFRKFNKSHERFTDAIYWLGRVQFIRGKYKKSAVTLAEFNSAVSDNDKRLLKSTSLLAVAVSEFAPAVQACAVYLRLPEIRKFYADKRIRVDVDDTETFAEEIDNLLAKYSCNQMSKDKLSVNLLNQLNPNADKIRSSNKIAVVAESAQLESVTWPKETSITELEIDRLRSHVASCWSPPIGAAGANTLIVDIIVTLDRDGKVLTAEVDNKMRLATDRTFQVAADEAIRTMFKCSPLPLPPEKHELWRSFVFGFDPSYLQRGGKKRVAKIPSFNTALSDGGAKKQIVAVPKAKPEATSAALTAAEKEAERLRQRVAALEAEKAKQQQVVSGDTQIPLITITQSGADGRKGSVKGYAKDNVQVAEVLIDGQAVRVGNDGSFEWSGFVPTTGKEVTIKAIDTAALSSTKTVSLNRGQIQQASGPRFDVLDPTAGKRVKRNSNALALIVGISDYKRTDAPAVYADKDAQYFHDYASLKLGISDSNIKTMVNAKAEQGDVILAVKDWMRRSSKPGKTDVYVFFAGHGLASDDGEQMYLLPYDGRPRLLDKTAILREELFDDIASANPRSVTVFLDTCYSGTTRGTDMLIASRPIAIKALEQSIPDNFTVMTAARGDQTAKPLEEAKHGMFSYFLMKGMEGEADQNQDNKITAGELHQYVQSNVVQQSSGSQTPELQGDAERVLVRFQ
ncbi:caspase family protein [Alphaproteobacteria bacterium]|nr:caspase family protein [Alphaproteobacteria bacterium]